jgi:hypothetical protein
MNLPARHHFVPEFYQKGFFGENGQLFALGKKFGVIKERHPSQILYKKHLYTLNDGDAANVTIEEFYSQIESEFARYVSFLQSVAMNSSVLEGLERDSHFKRIAKIVIATQFWRTPCQAERARKYSRHLLSLYDEADRECKEILGQERKFIKFLQRKAAKPNEAKVVQFFLLPLLSFDIWDDSVPIRLVYSGERQTYVASDRPVLHADLDSLFTFERFMFPLSKDVLMASEGCVGMGCPEIVNGKQLLAANEFVLSSSRELLEALKANMSLQPTSGRVAAPRG